LDLVRHRRLFQKNRAGLNPPYLNLVYYVPAEP